jgi:hypothetical protein
LENFGACWFLYVSTILLLLLLLMLQALSIRYNSLRYQLCGGHCQGLLRVDGERGGDGYSQERWAQLEGGVIIVVSLSNSTCLTLFDSSW